MFKQSIFFLALSAAVAVVDAQSHGSLAAAHHRGVHRRHHAKLQAAGQPRTARKRRSCPVKSSSTDAPASSVVPSAATLIADTNVPVTTPAASSSAASTSAPRTSSAKFSSSVIAASTADADDDATPSSSVAPSSSAPAASSTPTTNNAVSSSGSALRAIFPVSANSKWTTSDLASNSLPLSDATLRPTKVLSKLSHDYVNIAGKKAMQAKYAAGSWNFQQEPLGGFSFYAPGPASVDLTKAKEATLSYSVLFEEGFEFVKGGKLPGLYGGDNDDVATSCSGGRRDTKCFSSRFMWRTKGAMELYTYLPPGFDANTAACNTPPFTDCNPTYGASIGRGASTFIPGEWKTISQRVRLNDVGKSNGEIEVFENGKSLFTAKNIVLRDSEAGRIRGMQFQTFFGGSTQEWASPKQQNAYFADISTAITEFL